MKRYIRSSAFVGEPSAWASKTRSYHDDPADWQDKQARIQEFIAGLDLQGISPAGSSRWKMSYKAPDGDKFTFDLWEDELSIDDQLESFKMWARENGLL